MRSEEIATSIYERKELYLRVIGVSFSKISREEKEELFQEAMIRFLKVKIDFKSERDGLNYFRRIFMNMIVNETRERMKRKFIYLKNRDSKENDEPIYELFRSNETPEVVFERNKKNNLEIKLKNQVMEILNSMPHLERELIKNYFLGDGKVTIDDIAEKFDISRSMAYRRLQKGLKEIREKVVLPYLFFLIFFRGLF